MKLLILLSLTLAFGNSNFSPTERQGYTEKALAAFDKTSRKNVEALYQQINMAEKNKCRSIYGHLTLTCLKEVAQKNCKISAVPDCEFLSDVILVNKVSEKSFISETDRIKLSETSKNYSTAYGKFLFGKYSFLATDFLLTTKSKCEDKDFNCLARDADRYCSQNADTRNLSWQACISALIWFIAT